MLVAASDSPNFAAEFEQSCQARQLPLFVLPPRSPKLNGRVERAHLTHNDEFYEVTPARWNLLEVNRQLHVWEPTYNTIRPHQALGYATRWSSSSVITNPNTKSKSVTHHVDEHTDLPKSR